jgi:hypothetical protein
MSTSPFGSLKEPFGVALWVSDTHTKRVLRITGGESAIAVDVDREERRPRKMRCSHSLEEVTPAYLLVTLTSLSLRSSTRPSFPQNGKALLVRPIIGLLPLWIVFGSPVESRCVWIYQRSLSGYLQVERLNAARGCTKL